MALAGDVDWSCCDTRGCGLRFLANGHRNCCRPCRTTAGRRHSRRCFDTQRRLRNLIGRDVRCRESECYTAGCNRTAGLGFSCCCSACFDSRGRLHTRRCDRAAASNSHAGSSSEGNVLDTATSICAAGQDNADGIATASVGSEAQNDESVSTQEEQIDLDSLD